MCGRRRGGSGGNLAKHPRPSSPSVGPLASPFFLCFFDFVPPNPLPASAWTLWSLSLLFFFLHFLVSFESTYCSCPLLHRPPPIRRPSGGDTGRDKDAEILCRSGHSLLYHGRDCTSGWAGHRAEIGSDYHVAITPSGFDLKHWLNPSQQRCRD